MLAEGVSGWKAQMLCPGSLEAGTPRHVGPGDRELKKSRVLNAFSIKIGKESQPILFLDYSELRVLQYSVPPKSNENYSKGHTKTYAQGV